MTLEAFLPLGSLSPPSLPKPVTPASGVLDKAPGGSPSRKVSTSEALSTSVLASSRCLEVRTATLPILSWLNSN